MGSGTREIKLVVPSRIESLAFINAVAEEVATQMCFDEEARNAITISVVLLPPDLSEDPIGDDLITIPFVAAYNQRDFQTSKTVSNSTPDGGDTVVYTIKVVRIVRCCPRPIRCSRSFTKAFSRSRLLPSAVCSITPA